MSDIAIVTTPVIPFTDDTGPLARTLSAISDAACAVAAALCAVVIAAAKSPAMRRIEAATPAEAETTQSLCSASARLPLTPTTAKASPPLSLLYDLDPEDSPIVLGAVGVAREDDVRRRGEQTPATPRRRSPTSSQAAVVTVSGVEEGATRKPLSAANCT